MEALFGVSAFVLIIAIIIGLVLFFAPIIIILQLSKIINLLDKIGYSEEMHHQETIIALYGEDEEQEQAKQSNNDRTDELMKSLFNKNTPD